MNIQSEQSLIAILAAILIILSFPVTNVAATVGTTGEDEAAVIDMKHKSTVSTAGSFEVSVETSASAGTVVAIEPEGFQVEISANEGKVDGNQVQFLDPSAGDSMYTVEVNVIGGEVGDTAEIATWVNAEKREDAPDVSTSTITVGGAEADSDESGETSVDSGSTGSNEQKLNNQTNKTLDSTEMGNNSESNNSITGADQEVSQNNHNSNNESSENKTTQSERTDDSSNVSDESRTNNPAPGFGVITAMISLIVSGYALRQNRY